MYTFICLFLSKSSAHSFRREDSSIGPISTHIGFTSPIYDGSKQQNHVHYILLVSDIASVLEMGSCSE